jgi:hypothetical protein
MGLSIKGKPFFVLSLKEKWGQNGDKFLKREKGLQAEKL